MPERGGGAASSAAERPSAAPPQPWWFGQIVVLGVAAVMYILLASQSQPASPPTAHVLCGQIGAGKSTLARHLSSGPGQAVAFSPDYWVRSLYGDEFKVEDFQTVGDRVKAVIWEHAQLFLARGHDIVLDFSLWSRADRDLWLARVLFLCQYFCFFSLPLHHRVHHGDLSLFLSLIVCVSVCVFVFYPSSTKTGSCRPIKPRCSIAFSELPTRGSSLSLSLSNSSCVFFNCLLFHFFSPHPSSQPLHLFI
jgi:hypothetical protein